MRALADFILLVHFFWVLLVLLPIPLIWIGGKRGWHWIRNCGFRMIHLLMIGIVVSESLLGLACPLTLWEDVLRGSAVGSRGGFLQYWISKILFYDLQPWVFTAVYLCVGGVIAIEFWRIPPERKRKRRVNRLS